MLKKEQHSWELEICAQRVWDFKQARGDSEITFLLSQVPLAERTEGLQIRRKHAYSLLECHS